MLGDGLASCPPTVPLIDVCDVPPVVIGVRPRPTWAARTRRRLLGFARKFHLEAPDRSLGDVGASQALPAADRRRELLEVRFDERGDRDLTERLSCDPLHVEPTHRLERQRLPEDVGVRSHLNAKADQLAVRSLAEQESHRHIVDHVGELARDINVSSCVGKDVPRIDRVPRPPSIGGEADAATVELERIEARATEWGLT